MSRQMKAYRKMKDEELKALIKEYRFNIMLNQTRMGQAKASKKSMLDKVDGTSAIKNLKKEIARIKTLLEERRRER